MDASMAGGAQTTFVGVAAIEGRIVGACCGDSRAYLINERGCRLLTTRHLSDVPRALLDLAGARGRADDMTVVAMRVVAA